MKNRAETNGETMTKIRTVILLLLATGLAACAGIRPAPPEVQLSGLEITDKSFFINKNSGTAKFAGCFYSKNRIHNF